MPTAIPPLSQIASMHFTSESDGWVTRSQQGATQLLITHDGGDSWTVAADTGDVVPDATQFVDGQNGWIAGTIYKNCGFALQCPSRLLITHDGGRFWATVGGPTPAGPFSLLFVDPLDGWAVSSCRPVCTLFRTRDGGLTWSRMPQPWSPIRVDAQVAWTVGDNNLIVTRDGGQTWEDRPDPCTFTQPIEPSLHFSADQIDFISAETGWVECGALLGSGATIGINILYRTTDGGRTWSVASMGGDPRASRAEQLFPCLGRVEFLSAVSGWCASWLEGVWRTSDGGRTLQSVPSPIDHVVQIDFVDATHGWIADDSTIQRTTDAGAHWQLSSLPP